MQEKILKKLSECGITELANVKVLNELPGIFVNMESRLPNGTVVKILDDNATYYGCQAEITNSEKCYGVAADENQFVVYRYGCNGIDSEVVLWAKL